MMYSYNKRDTGLDTCVPRATGAGILPFSVDQVGNISVLLGKERYVEHWKGSLKWSAFEGSCKENESVEKAAAREFLEESMGAVKLTRGVETETVDTITKLLQDCEFMCQINLHIEPEPNRLEVNEWHHVVFLVNVCNSSECICNFTKTQKLLASVKTECLHVNNKKSAMFRTNPFILPGSYVNNELVIELHTASIKTDPEGNPHALEIVYRVATGVTTALRDIPSSTPTANLNCYINRIFEQRDVLARFSNVDNPSHAWTSKCERDITTHVHVSDEVMEKECVRWWTLFEIERVLANGGKYNSETFRAFFLPTLQKALKELKLLQMVCTAEKKKEAMRNEISCSVGQNT